MALSHTDTVVVTELLKSSIKITAGVTCGRKISSNLNPERVEHLQLLNPLPGS